MEMSLRGVKRRSNLKRRDCFAIACNDSTRHSLYVNRTDTRYQTRLNA